MMRECLPVLMILFHIDVEYTQTLRIQYIHHL